MDEGEVSDGFSEWELIQAPANSPLMSPLVEQHMVATATTKDNRPQHHHHLSVFPPSRHDALEEEEEEEEVNSSVTSWSMIKGDGGNSWPLKNTSTIGKILTNGALKLATRVGCYVGFGRGVWSGNIVVAAMLLSFLYAKARIWGGKVKEAKKDPLIRLIQEKDQVLITST